MIGLPILLVIGLASTSVRGQFTNTTDEAGPPDQECEEQAVLLSTQKERYDEFRKLQKFLLAKLSALDTKLELLLTPSVSGSNCSAVSTALSESVLPEVSEIKELTRRVGRNVDTITSEPTSCADIHAARARFTLPVRSGIYNIYVQGHLRRVRCDLDTAGGGWTILQYRAHGDVDFRATWRQYKHGFGDVRRDHWLSNDVIHRMTLIGKNKEFDLRVELTDWDDVAHYITYRGFSVGDENSRYKLQVGDVVDGNMSDALGGEMHNGRSFSTRDRFVNYGPCIDCPGYCKGAWWYGCCYYANLNGLLITPEKEGDKRGKGNHRLARWYDSSMKRYIHAKHTEMKFRPHDFSD